MRFMLYLCFLLLSGGCTEESSDGGTSARSLAAGGTYINFPDVPASMSAGEALFRLELAAKVDAGERIAGIIELVPGHDSSGNYKLYSSYASLADFLSHMNSQDPKYTWKSRAGTGYILVFVYPTSGARLTETVGAVSLTDATPCNILEEITKIVDPTRPGYGACVLRGNFRSIDDAEFKTLRSATYSYTIPSGANGLDAVEELMATVGFPAGLRVYSPFGSSKILWQLR